MNPSPSRLVSRAVLAALLACAATASAQTNLTWDIAPGTAGAGDSAITGGNGNWNTTNGNWTSDAGANNIAWNNAANNTAIFGSTASTVTLDEAINLRALQANTSLTSGTNYTFQGAALNFGTGGSISITAAGTGNWITRARFTTPITGAPAVTLNTGENLETQFSPSSGTMTLGAVGGGGLIALGGSTTGNRIASKNGKTRWNGSGSWELTGLAAGYEHFIDSGTLIVSTGTLRNDSRSVNLIGGTLHYNNPAAVNDARTNTGIDNDFRFRGGSVDNTRGTAITTSTHNPDMTWEANWTFIGSNGANSDLFIGTGDVRLYTNVQVTVQNAAATFTVGGVVMNDLSTARSLTKAGPGTLELRGNNTYTGATTVNAGTLAIPSGTSTSNISIGASGTLQLTPGSTPSTTGSIDFASGSKVRLTGTPTLPDYTLFTSTGPMTGAPVIETPVAGYELFIEGRSLKFAQNADDDSDGLPDWWELLYSTAEPPNNTSLDPGVDDDLDGLTNLQEYLRGTHPNNPDTDDDGLLDGVESNTGIWVGASDTGTDPLNPDSDGDSLLDGVETNTGIWVSATNTGTNPHLTDTDGDSYPRPRGNQHRHLRQRIRYRHRSEQSRYRWRRGG
jgi:autotransporter-associated beta strand protein